MLKHVFLLEPFFILIKSKNTKQSKTKQTKKKVLAAKVRSPANDVLLSCNSKQGTRNASSLSVMSKVNKCVTLFGLVHTFEFIQNMFNPSAISANSPTCKKFSGSAVEQLASNLLRISCEV